MLPSTIVIVTGEFGRTPEINAGGGRDHWPTAFSLVNTPVADFCRPVRVDHSALSPDSRTSGRSPEVSSTAFRTHLPDLQPVPVMDMGFAVTCPDYRTAWH